MNRNLVTALGACALAACNVYGLVPKGGSSSSSDSSYAKELAVERVCGFDDDSYDADKTLSELQSPHTTPDEILLLKLHCHTSDTYQLNPNQKDRDRALAVWTKGRQLAKVTLKPDDEFFSVDLRRAWRALDQIESTANSSAPSDPTEYFDKLKAAVAQHEASYLHGAHSVVGQQLLDQAEQVRKTNSTKFAAATASQAKWAAYNASPEATKLQQDFDELNRDAEKLARRIAEPHPTAWAQSTSPKLQPYRKRLEELQSKERQLQKKFGVSDGTGIIGS